MRKIDIKNTFKKDYRKVLKQGWSECDIDEVIKQLAGDDILAPALQDHPLMGDYKKLKNDRNNAKPSRGVILCDIVRRKNIKLGILIMSQKHLHKMIYLIRGFPAFGLNDQYYG